MTDPLAEKIGINVQGGTVNVQNLNIGIAERLAESGDRVRILVVAANPLGSSPLKLDHEVKTIQEALRRSRKRDNFEVKYQLAATPSELRRALLDVEPHVLHFSGHGAGEQGLLFVSDESAGAIYRSDSGEVRSRSTNSDEIKFVPAQPLANLLQLCDEHLECVVLNACYSDVQGDAISANIPFTIGMRDQVADNVAIKFSQGFYDAIGAGKGYESAFKWGKVAIEFDLANDEASKILILRKKGNTISELATRIYSSNSPSGFPYDLDDFLEQILYPSQNKNTYFDRAIEKHESGDNYGAIIDYSEAIRINPNNSAAFNNRGNVKSDLGDQHGAIADYNEAIRLDPKDAMFFNNRGLTKSALGDKEGEIEDYNEAIRLDPEYNDAYYNRGLAKSALGDREEAIADYNQAVRLDPEYIEAYYNRGLAKSALGNKEGAIDDYNEVIRLDPEHTEAYYNRGLTKSALGDKAGAIEDYNEVIRLNPSSHIAYNTKAWTKYLIGDSQGALIDVKHSLELNPKSSAANHTHGVILFYGLSCPRESVVAFTSAIELKANDSESHCDRGIVMASLGNTQEAIDDFTKAIIFNNNWDARSLADAYHNRGNTYQQIGEK